MAFELIKGVFRRDNGIAFPDYFDSPEDAVSLMVRRMDATSRNGISNCFGTGFYIVGERETDKHVWEGRDSILNRMGVSSRPNVGSLVGWFYSKPEEGEEEKGYHLAVVTSVNPLLVAHRYGQMGPLERDIPLDEVKRDYDELDSRMFFHMPNRFKNLARVP